jgi:hypothetical protein
MQGLLLVSRYVDSTPVHPLGPTRRHAAQPRLLIPIGLGAALAVYNSVAQQPLSLTDETSLLAGFLSYKVHSLPANNLCSSCCQTCVLSYVVCMRLQLFCALVCNSLLAEEGDLPVQVALLGRLWDSLKPKVSSLEDLSKPERPVVPAVEDVDDILEAISSRRKR